MKDTALLHDHLDGGARPSTLFELLQERGLPLPDGVANLDELEHWLKVRPGMDLGLAFERFGLPISVMQETETLQRIALEASLDLTNDGVTYAEVRFAPLLHTEEGLSSDQVVEAVLQGLSDGPTDCRLILCALRTENRTDELVDLAIRWEGKGVVGVDLAGPEVGFPVEPHAESFRRAKRAGLGVTLHAGEMDTYMNIASALNLAAADRIGHGWKLVDELQVRDGDIVGMGPVATEVFERNIPLEMCVSSNACLGVDPKNHPLRMMLRAGFNISLNTDNRTITAGPLSAEFDLVESLGCRIEDLQRLQGNALASRFI